LSAARQRPRLGALILTGGASSRMGSNKALLDWGGARAVDRCAALAAAVGADPIVTVGGRALGYQHVEDETPRAGPVGGIVAGAKALAALGCRRVLVLAVDAPTIEPADLSLLLDQPGPGAAFSGLFLPLVLDPQHLPAGAAADRSIRWLVEASGLAQLACDHERARRLRGANTPQERTRLLAELGPWPRPAGR